MAWEQLQIPCHLAWSVPIGPGTMECLTETGVLCEVSQEPLTVFLHVAAAPAGTWWGHDEAGGAGVNVVGSNVKPCSKNKEGNKRLNWQLPREQNQFQVWWGKNRNTKSLLGQTKNLSNPLCCFPQGPATGLQEAWGLILADPLCLMKTPFQYMLSSSPSTQWSCTHGSGPHVMGHGHCGDATF